MANTTSQHILNTSINLLGFCLFVITSFHLTNKADTSVIDEFTSVIAMLLIFSGFLSFLSIRTKNQRSEYRLETIAEYLFIASLMGIMLIVTLLVFHVVK